VYRPRRPTRTALYPGVQHHLQTFLARTDHVVAEHLVDHVLPVLPARQVVLSVPKRLRAFLHHRPDVATGVLHIRRRRRSLATGRYHI
jgi:hypothetical protein